MGDFVWAGMDYLAKSWSAHGSTPTTPKRSMRSGLGVGGFGTHRPDRQAAGRSPYTAWRWSRHGPYIAVCPVNHTGDRHSPSAWKMTNAMPSWSWTGCEERKASVEVYARAARVELVLNGHTVGSKMLKNDCLAKFSIPYESGTLEAVSYDAADHEIGRCSCKVPAARPA
mgnify:CR=1 FL=1